MTWEKYLMFMLYLTLLAARVRMPIMSTCLPTVAAVDEGVDLLESKQLFTSPFGDKLEQISSAVNTNLIKRRQMQWL